jgi:hypothetical protein
VLVPNVPPNHEEIAMTTVKTPTAATKIVVDPALDHAFACLAATLCEIFQLPCEEVLKMLNQRFAANPLTADFRLHLGNYPVGRG